MNGNAFRDAVISGANNITNNRKAVDELNVFPVPEGDTGTNMSLTMMAAAKEVSAADKRNSVAVVDALLWKGIKEGLKIVFMVFGAFVILNTLKRTGAIEDV